MSRRKYDSDRPASARGPKPRPIETVKVATIGVAVTKAERDAWHAAAQRAGTNLAELIRFAMRELLKRRWPLHEEKETK